MKFLKIQSKTLLMWAGFIFLGCLAVTVDLYTSVLSQSLGKIEPDPFRDQAYSYRPNIEVHPFGNQPLLYYPFIIAWITLQFAGTQIIRLRTPDARLIIVLSYLYLFMFAVWPFTYTFSNLRLIGSFKK
jgi:hypothetical protein